MNKRITPPADKPPAMKPNPQPAGKPRRASGARAKTPRPYIVISRKNILAWLLSAVVYGACMFCLGLVMGRGMIGLESGGNAIKAALEEIRRSEQDHQTVVDERIREDFPHDAMRYLTEDPETDASRNVRKNHRIIKTPKTRKINASDLRQKPSAE